MRNRNPATMDEIAEKRILTSEDVAFLNQKYKILSLTDRISELYRDFEEAEIMLTSSFAATSAFLLKLFSDENRNQRVYFIDTGYHFDETLKYKEELSSTYGLKVISVSAIREEHNFT